MMGATQLPEKFAFLQPFVATWGHLHTQNERYLKRQELPFAELQTFHEVLAPRLEEVFSYLDGFDPDALPEPEALLFRVVLGLTEAAQAVEIFGQSRVPYAPAGHTVNIDWIGYKPR